MLETTKEEPHRPVGQSFREHLFQSVRAVDVLVLAVVPAVLFGVAALPESTRRALAFDVGNPGLLEAYTAHFVHGSQAHLLGNVSFFVVFVSMTYLLFVLSDERSLFWYATFAFLSVFPMVLSAMQLSFSTERVTFGFSGVNAAFAGLLCLGLVRYVGVVLAPSISVQHAPALLFTIFGVISLISLPERAWRLELALLAFALAGLYLALLFLPDNLPSTEDMEKAVDNPGYVELAGAGFALALTYPYAGFRGGMIPSTETVDVYIHLLGFALAFIVVYTFVVVTGSDD